MLRKLLLGVACRGEIVCIGKAAGAPRGLVALLRCYGSHCLACHRSWHASFSQVDIPYLVATQPLHHVSPRWQHCWNTALKGWNKAP
jgi:hypothetical protein